VTLAAGSLLGRYRIEALIGAGGMGEVYRARDTQLGRTVAVKVLGQQASDMHVRERFEREATAIARLIHPHICRLYDIGRDGETSFLVMEYLEGETLANRIAREPMGVADAVTIAAEIADAVHAAHVQGLVHRDLKPSNVMLTADGVKLLDFGLVRFVGGDSESETNATTSALTGEGAVIGTIQYMSPEQIQGKAVDARCDVFAVGAMLYEMLAGTSPFARPSSIATIGAIVAEEPSRLQEKRPEVPAAVVKIVTRCLQKAPYARWPDAGALAAALRADQRPVRRRPSAPPNAPRATAPHAPIRRLAVLPIRNISGDAEQHYLADGVTEALMSALVEIRGLEIMSRASANRFVDRGADASALVKLAGIDAFLEGSIGRSGDRLHVAVRLVNAKTNANVWATTYDRGWSDWLTIGSEIATTVAAEIQLKISSGERRRRRKRHSTVPAAQEAYVRGRFLRSQGGADSLRLAFKHYTTALEIDPDYALAHVGLADWYLAAGAGRVMSAPEAMAHAKSAALRALELEPDAAEAHSCLGHVATYEWDLARAQRELEAAIRTDPNIAQAHSWLGRLCTYTKRFDLAVEHNRIAQRLDPLSPLTHVHAAVTLYSARRFAEAIVEAQRALELNPAFGNATYLIGLSEHFRGEHARALECLSRAQTASPDHPSPVTASAYVLGRLGRRAEALTFIEKLKERATRAEVSPYDFAEAYVGIGETDLAMEYLERSKALRLPELLGIGSDPMFDPLRSDPRFVALLAQIGLPA
jgi:eukaryotic-like serine/threonine-protein kinase